MDSIITNQEQANRLIMVTYSLPVTAGKLHVGVANDRPLSPLLPAVTRLHQQHEISEHVWVGVPVADADATEHHARNLSEITSSLKDHNISAVDVESSIYEAFYNGFCKTVLWPLLHYETKNVRFDYGMWNAYQKVNELFADKIANIHKHGDIIWINGYHLLLLPALLRARLPQAKISFFLHTPFPSVEIFRILAVREQILRGVLGAELIGFQTYAYLRYFLQACTRVLGIDTGLKGIQLNSHFVRVGVYPVGIDPETVLREQQSSEVQERIASLRKTYAGKRIILARDRLESTEATVQKLTALQFFLHNYPHWQDKVVMILICEPKTSAELDTPLLASIHELVGKLNGQYGRVGYQPIEYATRRIPFAEVLALNTVADVAFITPLREGMNLHTYEFVVCQGTQPGVLVLSEFIGSARSFGGAFLVNPWSKAEIAAALDEGLSLSEEELSLKQQHNYNYAVTNTCFEWASTFVNEIKPRPLMGTEINSSAGVGVSLAIAPELPLDQIEAAYVAAKKRIILLDYDGTLTPLVTRPENAIPPPELLPLLGDLLNDPANGVFIVSGRDRSSLERWLGHIPVGLSCEHGCFFRQDRWSGEGDGWEDVLKGVDMTWQETIKPIMEYYAERTPGASVEIKQLNLAWHYRNADSDFGFHQAQQLLMQLQSFASKFPVDVVMGNKVIEVKPAGVNKGLVVKRLLNERPDAEFLLCIGDDKTDEDMFAAADRSNPTHFSIVVGVNKATQAKYHVRDTKQVLKLLERLAKATAQSQR